MSHPGVLLRMEIDARGLSPAAFAAATGVPRRAAGEILAGRKGITPEVALRLGRYFSNPADFWLGLQARYDLDVAQRRLSDRILAEVEPAQPLAAD